MKANLWDALLISAKQLASVSVFSSSIWNGKFRLFLEAWEGQVLVLEMACLNQSSKFSKYPFYRSSYSVYFFQKNIL